MSEIDDALRAIAAAERSLARNSSLTDCRDMAENQWSCGTVSPLSSQVGGNHYSKLAIQPAEYTTRNGLGHMAGDAIAYITRYKDKNGKQDLEKAIHSIQLLIALEYPDHE